MCCCCFCCLKTEIENFQGAEHPSVFVGYTFQAVRIESSMKSIGSLTAFWKNMNKDFLPDIERKSTGLASRSLFKTCCTLDWFLFLFRHLQAFFEATATYLDAWQVCLWLFAVALWWRFKKSNSNSKTTREVLNKLLEGLMLNITYIPNEKGRLTVTIWCTINKRLF